MRVLGIPRKDVEMSRAKRNVESPYEKGVHGADFRELAKACIEVFFAEKSWFCGGSIPRRELISEFSITTVLRTQYDDRCFGFIHSECLPRIPNIEGHDNLTVSWEVHCLLQLIDELQKMHVPKELQPGLLLLYFKFCKGVKIPPPPLL
jgi:hypothetical protein